MSDAYTQPTLPQIYGAIARCAASVPGIKSAHYPAPGQLPQAPALVIFGGSVTIVHGTDQMWQLRPKAHLMVAALGASREEINRADSLLMPIVDAFAADVEDTDGFTLGGFADRCVVSDWDQLQVMGYGGHRYIGYPIFFDIKVHRHAIGA